MRIDTKDPRVLWQMYERGRGYNEEINLYNKVDTNEAFYAGDQWKGLDCPNIDKPVINQIRQPINYMVATIVSDDVSISLSPSLPSAEDERYLDAVVTEVERIREQLNMQTVNRESVRNAAVDGDACLYLYWDSDIKTGQPVNGDIRCQLIENINCVFGNPFDREIQRQPFIQIVMRDYKEDVIDEAVENGMSETEARELIKPDADGNQGESATDNDLVTKLITFYKRDGRIYAVISTEKAIIRKEWDTDLTLYPVAWFNWQRARRSYHGTSIVTEMIPTQIYVNKLAAFYLRCTSMYAWPKIIYNRAKFPKGWDSRVGVNVEVDGNPNDAYAAIFPGAGATADVTNTLEWLKSNLKESSGANDAALGQMKSDNTSAIIAMQEANTVPLDLQRQGYYDYQEQITRIMLDMLRAYAGTRYVELSDDEKAEQAQIEAAQYQGMGGEYDVSGIADGGIEGTLQAAQGMPTELSSPVLDSADSIGTTMDIADAPMDTKPVDFSKLGDMAWQLKVDIGAGSYYSEVIRQRTLDNLMSMGVIDTIEYLERVSDKYIGNKQALIDAIKERNEMMQTDATGGAAVPTADEIDQQDQRLDDSARNKQAKSYIQGLRQGL